MSERRLSPAISILALATALAQAALGDAVIGTGTPESCTEQALRTAFYVGGNITFDCGPNPVTITVTTPLATPYRVAVNIDGGNLITLSGGGKTRVLEMPEGPNSLSNITIADGMHPVQGSAMVGGALVDNCTFLNNTISSEPRGGGGAIYAGGSWPFVFHVSNSTFLNNKGGGHRQLRGVGDQLYVRRQ